VASDVRGSTRIDYGIGDPTWRARSPGWCSARAQCSSACSRRACGLQGKASSSVQPITAARPVQRRLRRFAATAHPLAASGKIQHTGRHVPASWPRGNRSSALRCAPIRRDVS